MDIDNLVSVITPNYNCARFIGQTIESVLSQTYRNWEMLIVDDCSTDNSVEIIEKYIKQDERIKLFSTDKKTGSPVEPRNIGIKNAQGRYIAFLDSDDIWLPKKLENQIKQFNDDKVVIVFSYYEKISEKGVRKNRIITSPSSITYNNLLKGDCIGSLTAIYDTGKVGKYYLKHIGAEDYAYWLSILKSNYIARNTNTVEALYRIRNNSLSTNKIISAKWTWDIYRKELKLNIIKCVYYYIFYLIKAIIKTLK